MGAKALDRRERAAKAIPPRAVRAPSDSRAAAGPGATSADVVRGLQGVVGNRSVSQALGGAARAKVLGGELEESPPKDSPVEIVVEIGPEDEATSGEQADEDVTAKSRVGGGPVAVSVAVAEPGPAGAGRPAAVYKAATRVEAGPASQPLTGNQYGRTDTESVQVTIDAKKVGNAWHPVVKNLVGRYSLVTRLLPGQTEVTGPSGNTAQTNFCDQVAGLATLGNTIGNPWYMLEAVNAHERVHETRMRPALVAAEPAITAAIEAVSVPDAPDMTKSDALAALQADPAFLAATQAARQTWDAEYVRLITGDHNGPTDAAEHRVVDPMIRVICNHAKTHKWGPCPGCP